MNEDIKNGEKRPIKIWKAALYIRLSKEDEETKAESNSITSQREFLKEYLKQHEDITLYDFYVDDGFSGTNFNRPDFQRMISDIYSKRVDCVIVKDLSRFGRNASESSNYIDNVFAKLQVRFIALHNYIDTVENKMNAATHCITVGIQNVINESVAATTSVNVRGTLNVERHQGKFIGSFAPYGYKKNPDNHHCLIVDEPAAQIVRKIFELFLGGKSIIGIAKELNEAGIPNPSSYKKLQGLKYRHSTGVAEDGLWPDSSVRRILQNEVYIGNMVQGKNTTISFKHKQCRAIPKSEWIIVKSTHQSIIDKDMFDRAQLLFNKNIRKAPQKNDVDLFAGLVRCSDCRRIMSKKTNIHPYGVYEYYRCSTNKKMKKNICGNHTVRIDKLKNAITDTLRKMVDLSVEMSEIISKINSNPNRKNELGHLNSTLDFQKKEREKLFSMKLELYPDWKNGVITKDEYLHLKDGLDEKIKVLDSSIMGLEDKISNVSNGTGPSVGFVSDFKKYGNITELTRPMLTDLIKDILVYEGGRIEVVFKCKDSFEEALEYIKTNENGNKITA